MGRPSPLGRDRAVSAEASGFGNNLQPAEPVQNAAEESRGRRVEVAAEERYVSDRFWLGRGVSGLRCAHGSGLGRDRIEEGFPYEEGQPFEGLGEFRSLLRAVASAGNSMRRVAE